MDGILNILKPPGMTSHDVINWVRKTLNEKKAGHIGTLDPGASGVLPIFLGKGTKIIPFINDDKKIYRAQIIFGKTTDTQDQFGKILEEKIPNFTLTEFNEVLESFMGNVKQKPSMYSAIKVKGKKLYEYARENKAVDVPERYIHIHEIKVIHHNIPEYAFIEVTCSKGTYIRTLCHDIGNSLGCGAHMGFLLRTHSGDFNLSSAYTLEEIEKAHNNNLIDEIILPMDFSLDHHIKLNIKESAQNSLMNGNPIFPQGMEENIESYKEDQLVKGYINGKLVALGKIQYDTKHSRLYFKPIRVLA